MQMSVAKEMKRVLPFALNSEMNNMIKLSMSNIDEHFLILLTTLLFAKMCDRHL